MAGITIVRDEKHHPKKSAVVWIARKNQICSVQFASSTTKTFLTDGEKRSQFGFSYKNEYHILLQFWMKESGRDLLHQNVSSINFSRCGNSCHIGYLVQMVYLTPMNNPKIAKL